MKDKARDFYVSEGEKFKLLIEKSGRDCGMRDAWILTGGQLLVSRLATYIATPGSGRVAQGAGNVTNGATAKLVDPNQTNGRIERLGGRMKTTIKLGAALLALALSAAAATAQQQGPYPNRPITWVVPFGAGGVTDNSARFVAKVLSEKIGQPVIIENKPGAAGIVGAEYVAQAKPDGYTMLYASSGPMATFSRSTRSCRSRR